MSPDDVFAAQMWPWPDPLIKRDPSGRVLFVNAAFLALYGGRVENWTGNTVQGWPAPTAPGQPYRFETRAGAAPQENIYDWVEVTLADGNALAIARDVTVFHAAALAQPQQMSNEPVAMTPAEPAQQSQIQTAQDQTSQAPSVSAQAASQTPQSASQASQAAPIVPATPALAPEIIPAQNFEAQVVAAAVDPTPAAAHQPQIQAESAPVIAPAPQAEPQTVIAKAPSIAPASPQIEGNSVSEQTPEERLNITIPEPAPEVEPTRDFERRALPLENEESVLGSNWRDAVIARAVGGAVPSAQVEAAPEPAPQAKINTPAAAAPQGESPMQSLRVLLAEDNAINALLTRTLLEADGCVVETVEDGQLAVEAVKNNIYDLVLMDMRMPNMDGLEATRKIRSMGARTEKLPIIALTANAFDDDRNACFDSGMNDFMTKPVSAEELSAMVTNWMNKSRDVAA